MSVKFLRAKESENEIHINLRQQVEQMTLADAIHSFHQLIKLQQNKLSLIIEELAHFNLVKTIECL